MKKRKHDMNPLGPTSGPADIEMEGNRPTPYARGVHEVLTKKQRDVNFPTRAFFRCIVAVALLTSCAPASHFTISNQDRSFEQAQHDLNACRLDAAKASQAAPAEQGLIAQINWVEHRNEITGLCLKDKGYAVSDTPGPCIKNCDGKTEIAVGGFGR